LQPAVLLGGWQLNSAVACDCKPLPALCPAHPPPTSSQLMCVRFNRAVFCGARLQ
jgi:hypothetical protein